MGAHSLSTLVKNYIHRGLSTRHILLLPLLLLQQRYLHTLVLAAVVVVTICNTCGFIERSTSASSALMWSSHCLG